MFNVYWIVFNYFCISVLLQHLYIINENDLPILVYVHLQKSSHTTVPTGSPSHGGDVGVYVFDVNLLSLPTPFILFLCLFLS